MSETTDTAAQSRVESFRDFATRAHEFARRNKGSKFEAQPARHADAVDRLHWAIANLKQSNRGRPHETAMGLMLAGWLLYMDACRAEFDTHPEDDGVLGDPWRMIGASLRALLDGEIGALDAGEIDSTILAAMRTDEAAS